MSSRSDISLRVRNRINRLVRRIPMDVVSPVVPDDVYAAHVSLFDFLSAFTLRKSVLFDGDQPYGAAFIAERGAASVTALIEAGSARRFARRAYGSSSRADFPDSVPDTRRFDAVIHAGGANERSIASASRLNEGGMLLLSVPPSPDIPAVMNALRSTFASVRCFAHTCDEPIDLSSPARSTLTPHSFRFTEIAEAPTNALGVVIMGTSDSKWRELQLHIGSGPVALPGWVNIDNQPYEGVDFLWDASRGIPFRNARYVFAEHFIEHLSYMQGAEFAARCREVLADDGVLRMSTPNLDWVWVTSYHPHAWPSADEALRECFVTNRAFRGWGHQFLYNIQTLSALLRNAGFDHVRAATYGESTIAALAGIEHHEKYPDSPDLPHVIVVEATGRRRAAEIEGADMIREYERDVAVR